VSNSSISNAMSVEKFIDALEERRLLSGRLVAKLRAKLSRSEKPPTAKSIAKFLVEKKHLTQREATEVLAGLVQRGVDVDPAAEEEPQEAQADTEITPIISPASAIDVDSNPLPQVPADAVGEDYEGSSIFEPHPPNVYDEPAHDDGADIRLAPDSELDAPAADRPATSKLPESEAEAGEMPALADIFAKGAASDAEDSPLAEQPLVDEPLESPAADVSRALETKVKRRKKKKLAKRTNEWDSPLILLGGGGLALLLLGGLTIAWLLNTESADEVLVRAQKAVDTGSYTQAVSEYQEFLENFPRHRDTGLARVKLAMVQLRKATEASNYEIALDIANTELEAIENEEKFGEVAHAELAALLPRIALGLAQEAEAASDPQAAKKLVDQSTAALAFTSSTKYVPKSFRDEAELAEVREILGRVERRQQSQQALQQTIADMEHAVSGGDIRAAYARHAQFIKQHPELSGEAALGEMVQKTTAAEQVAIRFVADEQAAETAERKTPWLASLAIANRRTKPAASPAAASPGEQGAACLRINGAVYGLDAATGRLLWRRHVGHAQRAWPISFNGHLLVADIQRHELLRLDSATGQLLWRQALGEPFTEPLVVAERGFVPADSGRLYVIDMKSGARMGYVQFAQPLRVTPAANAKQERIYLPGDHSSLYALSLADLSCLGVHYLGHAEGSITVPLIPVLNKLAVLENDGVETSRLRLMSIDDKGSIAGQVVEKRLTGLATSPPFVAGRRLIVATDRGQIDVYEVASAEGKDALTLVATRAAAGSQPLVRHAALTGNHIWVGDTQLTKYSILPTGNRLPVESIENNFEGAAFDHPLAQFGKTLVHARRPKGRAGFVVAATDSAQGRTLWETEIAVPPAGPPIVDDSGKTLAVASAAGHLFRFDEAAMRARVVDEPLATQSMPAQLPPLTFAVDLGQGRAVFGAPQSDRLLLYNPADGAAAKWIALPSPLACDVTRLGEGFVAPLKIGQVFHLSAADGAQLAAPFQPLLQPRTTTDYRPAGAVEDGRFVISDGKEKLYLVALSQAPQPHLQVVAEAKVPQPIESRIVVLGNDAIAVAGSSHLVRFRLPSLESAGEANLPAPVAWGPFPIGESVLLVTANDRLMAISAAGEIAWQAAVEHGELAGAPLAGDDSVLLAYRSGILERRSLVDGKPLSTTDVEHPLAAGPVQFLQRLVLTAGDGTLLVVDEP
jgi:outer membrane protein assembly factor BamB